MKIKDVMTKNPVYCTPETKLDTVAHLMLEHNCGEIPILDDRDELIGVVTDRDIACRGFTHGHNPFDVPVREIMTTEVVTTTENEDVDLALIRMQDSKVRRLPVVRGDKLVGIISLADLTDFVRTGRPMAFVSPPANDIVPAP